MSLAMKSLHFDTTRTILGRASQVSSKFHFTILKEPSNVSSVALHCVRSFGLLRRRRTDRLHLKMEFSRDTFGGDLHRVQLREVGGVWAHLWVSL